MGSVPQTTGSVNLSGARQWAAAEAAQWRAAADPDAFDFAGFAASILDALARALRAQGSPDARAFAARFGLDLDAPPAPPRRAARLAEDLDGQAGYYHSIGTDAARLAACEFSRYADQAERMGSDSPEEWVLAEAAWRAACEDLVSAGVN